MVIISRYRIKRKGDIRKVLSYEDPVCPKCGRRLTCIGTRKRKLIDESGQRLTYIIRRLRCPTCGKIHHELPDIFTPHHLICSALLEHLDDAPLDKSSITKLLIWWHLFKKYTGCINTIEIREKVNHGLIDNTCFMLSSLIRRSKIHPAIAR